VDWREANHASELIPPLVQWQPAGSSPANWTGLLELPVLKKLAAQLARLREPARDERLTPALAEKLHGSILNSSVSRLEEFAQCPFRFFIHSGLRAAERKLFELDARERGSFQHEVLRQFHEGLDAAGRRWRELTPSEAQDRVGTIAASVMAGYRDGLLQVDAKSRFTARMLTEALQEFIGILVGWMHGQYEFDPVKSELDFGFQDSPAPAWVIELEHGHRLALRGRIDRIDLCRVGGQSLCVVIDYKSSPRKLDKLLMEHGVQLQLLAYLSVVASWPATVLGAGPVVPAGVFYVNLNGRFVGGRSRTEALADAAAAGRLAYRHSGRFDASRLDQLDRVRVGDQFHYQLNLDGRVRSNSAEAWSAAEFAKWSGRVEIQLRAMGDRIFSGEATVDPFRQGGTTACDYCDYRAACRIDPWTQPWRVLRAARETAAPAATSPTMDRARDDHEKP
jgi:ATP-dependent helicase/nuclease subunit B